MTDKEAKAWKAAHAADDNLRCKMRNSFGDLLIQLEQSDLARVDTMLTLKGIVFEMQQCPYETNYDKLRAHLPAVSMDSRSRQRVKRWLDHWEWRVARHHDKWWTKLGEPKAQALAITAVPPTLAVAAE